MSDERASGWITEEKALEEVRAGRWKDAVVQSAVWDRISGYVFSFPLLSSPPNISLTNEIKLKIPRNAQWSPTHHDDVPPALDRPGARPPTVADPKGDRNILHSRP